MCQNQSKRENITAINALKDIFIEVNYLFKGFIQIIPKYEFLEFFVIK